MATYLQLKTKVLKLVEQVGSSDVAAIAEIGLEETMKFVAIRVPLASLRGTALYTWQSGDTEANIATDFGVANFEFAERLFVANVPYAFRDYATSLDLQNTPGARRMALFEPFTQDERPAKSWTIDDSSNIIPYPVNVGNELKLRYIKSPAPYADATVPEIPTLFDFILVNGATMICKEYLLPSEKKGLLNPYAILQALEPQINELDIYLHTLRKDNVIKIHPAYRA
jgi:hypothetical protein